MDDALAQLEKIYCPPLDPALLAAIVSDYDLDNDKDLQEAQCTLDELKESALLEEAAGFDPTGTASYGHDFKQHDSSSDYAAGSHSRETDVTSLSNGLSSIDLYDCADGTTDNVATLQDIEELDYDTKVALLQDVVGDRVSSYTVRHTLSKCNEKWHAAMEELLNHVYFAESSGAENEPPVYAKGIDAFFEPNGSSRYRRLKGKSKRANQRSRQQNVLLAASDSPAISTAPARNIWNSASKDIEFIASRTRIASSTVSSAYHNNGASIPRTLQALLDATKEESIHTVTDEHAVAAAAEELGQEFPQIQSDSILTLVRLTHPSTSTAHELARALVTTHPTSGPSHIHIVPKYAPISELVGENGAESDHKISTQVTVANISPNGASSRAMSYQSMRAAAFAQAREAHRRARSDRYMGGAAVYYSDLAREHAALQSTASATAADQLAAAQSTGTELDLHGIDVLNGVRIAKQRVAGWWSSTAENRTWGRHRVDTRQQGFRIIVGLGRHSEGGKGKLGPAVSKALRTDGWKIESTGAVILVTGRVVK